MSGAVSHASSRSNVSFVSLWIPSARGKGLSWCTQNTTPFCWVEKACFIILVRTSRIITLPLYTGICSNPLYDITSVYCHIRSLTVLTHL